MPCPAAPAEPDPVSVELMKKPSGAISLTPVFRSQHGDLVLDQLAAVRADQAAQEDRIRVVALIFCIRAW
jgi:hypothetical protein